MHAFCLPSTHPRITAAAERGGGHRQRRLCPWPSRARSTGGRTSRKKGFVELRTVKLIPRTRTRSPLIIQGHFATRKKRRHRIDHWRGIGSYVFDPRLDRPPRSTHGPAASMHVLHEIVNAVAGRPQDHGRLARICHGTGDPFVKGDCLPFRRRFSSASAGWQLLELAARARTGVVVVAGCWWLETARVFVREGDRSLGAAGRSRVVSPKLDKVSLSAFRRRRPTRPPSSGAFLPAFLEIRAYRY